MKIQRKPEWLRKKVSSGVQSAMRGLLSELQLNTICQEALCPNIGECYGCGQASFMILGKDCTRQCSFCNVDKGVTPLPPDSDEPRRLAEAVVRLKLSNLVITSPTRDDLPDGGAEHFAAAVAAIYSRLPEISIELLVPDFAGDIQALKTVLASRPAILAHNLETVPRLYSIRKGADYVRSLKLLEQSAVISPDIPTKSGIMMGLGEKPEEVEAVMTDLRNAGCCFLSLGQYLAPSRLHHPVIDYIRPELFDELRQKAIESGFRHVESSPYTRSSYHAANYK